MQVLSALYALSVYRLNWIILVIVCLNESLCMHFGVWVVIMSANDVVLAILKQDREKQRQKKKAHFEYVLKPRFWSQIGIYTQVSWSQFDYLIYYYSLTEKRKGLQVKFSGVKQMSIDLIGQDVDTITDDTSDNKEEQMYIEKNGNRQQ